MSEHTQGPWKAERRNGTTEVGNFVVVEPSDGPCIGYIADPVDARLIASAPELLEALREVVALSDRKHDAWDKAKAAIAKAEGAA